MQGWKLGAYLRGRASVDLVNTYVGERQNTASELIEFDRNWSKIFKSTGQGQDGTRNASFVKDQFVRSGRYTAGQAYKYGRSLVVWPGAGDEAPDSTIAGDIGDASQLVVGMRFPSAQVVRFSDAKVFQLLSVLQSDGRWRVVVFDGDIEQQHVKHRLERVGQSLGKLIEEFTPEGSSADLFIEPLLVLKAKRTEVELTQLPEAFKPITGAHKIRSERFGIFLPLRNMTDLDTLDLHKVFFDDESYNSGHGRAFEKLGVSVNETTVVVVRPDQCQCLEF